MKSINRRHEPYTELKKFMSQHKIKQQELARLLDKTVSAVNQNLNGTGGDFSASEIRLICITYGLSADAYFFRPNVSN